jgi:hypothetical protein
MLYLLAIISVCATASMHYSNDWVLAPGVPDCLSRAYLPAGPS